MSKILVVDDEPFLRQLLMLTLGEFEDEGVELLNAANGQDALNLIKKECPSLVFMDIMMPEMNGIEVCNEVKNGLGMHDTYIVLLSAKGEELDKEKGREAGADHYMTKPFNTVDVLAKAREILEIK